MATTSNDSIYFRALYAFQGDRFVGQMSFPAGATLVVVDPVNKSNVNGWAQGHMANDPSRSLGWFPLTYVERIHHTIQPPPRPTNAVPQTPVAHSHWNNKPHPSSNAQSLVTTPASVTTLDQWSEYESKVQKSSSSQPAPIPATGEDDNFGFGGAPMGGSWNGSTAMATKGSGFGSVTGVAANFGNNHNTNPVTVTASSTRRASAIGPSIGNRLSQAASRTGTAFSNAASKTASATKSAFQETGHRLNDLSIQHNNRLDRTPPSHHTNSITSSAPGVHHQQERTMVSSGGIMPGRKTDTTRTTQKAGGTTTTTVTTTEKASGGFMPWIPGKITTTQRTSKDVWGNTRVTTEQKSGGGFYVIPLGPIGLAACGAIAAKNAFDNNKDRQQKTG